MHKDSSLKISVVIPVYLGELTIQPLCEELEKVLQSIAPGYELILVNDASPDTSMEKIEHLCKKNNRIKGIDLSRNFGQHAAISAGLKYAFGEKIIIMDCDLQDAPEDLPRLVEKALEGYDIVMAKRSHRKEIFWKKIISSAFHLILSLKIGKRTDPSIANYAVYDRKVIEEYYAQHNNRAFSVLNLKQRYSFATVDVEQRVSGRGKSSYTLLKLFSLAFSLLFPTKINHSKPLYVIQRTINIALEGYDVRLVPLTGEKIETLRQWRNDPDISRYMEYREYITREMQQKWFESINNPNNYYFIIRYEGKETGLINIKNIDYTQMTGESGLFIYDRSCLNTDIPFRVSLCLGDFTTRLLNLQETCIHVLRTNRKAVAFSKTFGYKLAGGQEDIDNQKYCITRDSYLKQREYIRNLLH